MPLRTTNTSSFDGGAAADAVEQKWEAEAVGGDEGAAEKDAESEGAGLAGAGDGASGAVAEAELVCEGEDAAVVHDLGMFGMEPAAAADLDDGALQYS